MKNQILPFSTLNEQLPNVVPPEYIDAISWGLAARLRPSYGLGPDAQVIALAKMTLNTLRQANLQVPIASLPRGFPRGNSRGGGLIAGLTGGIF